MKKLVVVFLCFFASNAFASSADSGRCPWKIPFTITIHAIGSTDKSAHDVFQKSGNEKDTNYGTSLSTDDFEFTIDTSSSYLIFVSDNPKPSGQLHYSLLADTLRYSYWYDDTGYMSESMSFLIAFARGTDSIISLNCSISDSGTNAEFYEDINTYTFQFFAALFDDTSIFTSDSSLLRHGVESTDDEMQLSFVTASPYDYFQYAYDDFTASSVTLSGIFRPTTFSDPPSIVSEASQPNNLAIYASDGSIACSFDVADRARELEIFSPLGIREASVTIPAGQTEASLPHLPAGFYFVRLEGATAKIYISGY